MQLITRSIQLSREPTRLFQQELCRNSPFKNKFRLLNSYQTNLSNRSNLTNMAAKTTLINSSRNYFISIRSQQEKKAKEQESAFSSLIQSSESNVSTHVTGAKRGILSWQAIIWFWIKSYNFLTKIKLNIAKQAATDVSYFAVIAAGGVMLSAIGYYLFTALFSRETPEGIYNESSKICLNHPDVNSIFF